MVSAMAIIHSCGQLLAFVYRLQQADKIKAAPIEIGRQLHEKKATTIKIKTRLLLNAIVNGIAIWPIIIMPTLL
jgi:hypothetical protein